jgi:ABC-type polysaccharide/polyol phosphate export permease
MSALKKFLGIIWIIIGPLAMTFLFLQAIEKVGLTHTDIERTNTILQWGIILFIFLPISIGLMIFGFYAIKGEYDHLPATSEEL